MAELEGLMLGYQQADSAATSMLIRQVSPLLLRFFNSQCGSNGEAEDLLQDTWLQIHKARHTYRTGEPFLPWIYAIARHVKVDSYRRTQRLRSREQLMNPAGARRKLAAERRRHSRIRCPNRGPTSKPARGREHA